MYVCMYSKYVLTYQVRRSSTTEFTREYRRISTEGAQTHTYGENKEYTYGLSDYFKFGRSQLKARQCKQSHVYLGVFESKSDTMPTNLANSRAPEVCFFLFIVCNSYWTSKTEARYWIPDFRFIPEKTCGGNKKDATTVLGQTPPSVALREYDRVPCFMGGAPNSHSTAQYRISPLQLAKATFLRPRV